MRQRLGPVGTGWQTECRRKEGQRARDLVCADQSQRRVDLDTLKVAKRDDALWNSMRKREGVRGARRMKKKKSTIATDLDLCLSLSVPLSRPFLWVYL